ncbi:MAG: hypothetical protein CL666_14585 [Balneola sp.]|nr:hypothetical protein [Balneola sp.]|tara:strand:+ start:57267 stop:57467 length:201 start_codon:yes stop_codon:yes gene_type:complete
MSSGAITVAIVVLIVAFILFVIWAFCRAAGEADATARAIYENQLRKDRESGITFTKTPEEYYGGKS